MNEAFRTTKDRTPMALVRLPFIVNFQLPQNNKSYILNLNEAASLLAK